MWELDHKEGWVPKNWCFRTVVLEKTLWNPPDCKETKPVYPKGNQLCILSGNTDAEAESPILWTPDTKSWLIGKDPDAGKDWRQEKGTTEDNMIGWYHWFNGHEFEQTLGDGKGQGNLLCCSPWGHKESDMTEWLINNNNNISAGHRGSSRYLGSVRKMPLHRSCTAPAVPPCGWSYSVYRLHGVGRGAKE